MKPAKLPQLTAQQIQQLRIQRYNESLKTMKRELGSDCTFLSNYKDTRGNRAIKTIIKGKTFMFSFPKHIEEVTPYDFKVLQELIQEKI